MWNLIPVLGSIIDKLIPDPKVAAEAKLKAIELAQNGELAKLDAELKLSLGRRSKSIKLKQAQTCFAAAGDPLWVGLAR